MFEAAHSLRELERLVDGCFEEEPLAACRGDELKGIELVAGVAGDQVRSFFAPRSGRSGIGYWRTVHS